MHLARGREDVRIPVSGRIHEVGARRSIERAPHRCRVAQVGYEGVGAPGRPVTRLLAAAHNHPNAVSFIEQTLRGDGSRMAVGRDDDVDHVLFP